MLRPVWTSKPETANRLRQRIEAVLDYAAAQGLRDGPNPSRWRSHLQNLLPRPSAVRRVHHHPALDWRDMPAFMADLRQRDGISARALEFVVLTAARSGEVRGMRWDRGRFPIVPLDRAGWSHERRQGTPRSAHRQGYGDPRRARTDSCTGVPRARRSGSATERHGADGRPEEDETGRHNRPWLSFDFPRLGR